MASSQLIAAILVAASAVVLCPACAAPANSGLCHLDDCRRAVLPQIKQPRLNAEARSGRADEAWKRAECTPEDAATRRARRRNARKLDRVQRLFAGEFAPARHARLSQLG